MSRDRQRTTFHQLLDVVRAIHQKKSAASGVHASWLGWDGWVDTAEMKSELGHGEEAGAANRITVRPARENDLVSLNEVVEAGVMSWKIPERVKRLAMSSYHYHANDLAHQRIVLAETEQGEVAGVVAWEPANPEELPANESGLLLHGLFVAPRFQGQGVGHRLVDAALEAVRRQKLDGLLVKAQEDAVGFYQSVGFTRLKVENPDRDYPNRLWKSA